MCWLYYSCVQRLGDIITTSAAVISIVTTLHMLSQVMMRNLVTRGCPLYSLEAYPDLEAQKARCVPAACCSALARTPNPSPDPPKLTAPHVPAASRVCGAGTCLQGGSERARKTSTTFTRTSWRLQS